MKIGELGRADRIRCAATGSVRAALDLPRVLRGTRGTAGSAATAAPPDSRLARAAAEQAVDELDPVVLAHSYRCWQWSVAFAEIDRLAPDPESMFVAALLHDLALGAPEDPEYGCFAALSGARAGELVTRHRGPQAAATVRDAISAHFLPWAPDDPVAAVLHSAVNLDVVGRRLDDVDPGLVDAVERAHPRTAFVPAFTAALAIEAQRRPRSAAAVLWRAGAALPIRMNPLQRAADRSGDPGARG
ncbi:HD domain-containing protein [Gordonia iterans]